VRVITLRQKLLEATHRSILFSRSASIQRFSKPDSSLCRSPVWPSVGRQGAIYYRTSSFTSVRSRCCGVGQPPGGAWIGPGTVSGPLEMGA